MCLCLMMQGRIGEALGVMAEMEGRGIRADVVLLTTLLDACLKVHTARHCLFWGVTDKINIV